MWQSIDASAIPTTPPNPPSSASADDLTVLNDLLTEWQNYTYAWQQIYDALNTDPNYVTLTAKMNQAIAMGLNQNVSGKGAQPYGWISGDGTPWRDATSQEEFLAAQNQLNNQKILLQQAQSGINVGTANVATVQGYVSQFSNTAGGKATIGVEQTNAQTALSAQQAATAAATAKAQTKKTIILATVILVVVVAGGLILLWLRKKYKKQNEKTK